MCLLRRLCFDSLFMLGHFKYTNSWPCIMPHQTLKNRFFIKIHARPIGIPFRTSGSPCIQIKCGSPRHLKGHGGDSPMVEIDDVNSGVGELRRGVEANEIHGCLYVVKSPIIESIILELWTSAAHFRWNSCLKGVALEKVYWKNDPFGAKSPPEGCYIRPKVAVPGRTNLWCQATKIPVAKGLQEAWNHAYALKAW